MANLHPVIKVQYFDDNGDPLSGGKLYTYVAGTTTNQATYTDQGAGTPNANPVVLDSAGRADVWLDPSLSYKFVLKDSADSTIWTVDNVVGLLSTGAVVTESIAASAVTTAKIADDAVTADKLSDSASVDADRAVNTNHIKDGGITGGKLNSGVVDDSTLEISSNTLQVKDAGITQAKRAALGQQVSSAITNPSITATSYANTGLTALTVTITTTGRPVYVGLIQDTGSSNEAFSNVAKSSNGAVTGDLKILRDGTTTVASFRHEIQGTTDGSLIQSIVPLSGFHGIDIPTAGTYTYDVEAQISNASDTFQIAFVKLIAFEL